MIDKINYFNKPMVHILFVKINYFNKPMLHILFVYTYVVENIQKLSKYKYYFTDIKQTYNC